MGLPCVCVWGEWGGGGGGEHNFLFQKQTSSFMMKFKKLILKLSLLSMTLLRLCYWLDF